MSVTISATFTESTRQINGSFSITAGAKELIFSSNEIKTVTNTTTKTFINSVTDYQGSYAIPANTLQKGDLIEIYAEGELSTGTGQKATIEIALGTDIIKTSLETLPNNLSEMHFDLKATIRIISTTSCILVGRTIIQTLQGVAAPALRNLNSNGTGAATIDITKANDVNVSYQWENASASNILRVDVFTMKLIRV